LVAALLAACSTAPRVLAGIQRQPAPDVSSASLPDVTRNGAPLSFQADPGKVMVVYFGYTACPDICPTTMADLKVALSKLGTRAQQVEVAMATVDPGRDSADILERYVHTFIPDGHVLRTDDDSALRAAAEAFGADYAVTTSADGNIEVEHTTLLYAVDDQGKLVLSWAFGTSIDDLRNDLEILVDRA
jgi:protein SCO1/2